MTALPPLPEPFGWEDGQITAAVGAGEVRFTTKLPGALGVPVDLKHWTEPAAAAALAAQIGLPAARIAQSHQVHEARARTIRSGISHDSRSLFSIAAIACLGSS